MKTFLEMQDKHRLGRWVAGLRRYKEVERLRASLETFVIINIVVLAVAVFDKFIL